MLYERPPQFPLPDGWGFRLITAIASLMRSMGALLAMFSTATLADFYLSPSLSFLPLPRGIGNSLLRAIPELLFFLLLSWLLLRFGHGASLAELGLRIDARAMKDLVVFSLAGAASVSALVLPLVWLGLGSFRFSEPRIQNVWLVLLCIGLLFVAAFSEELFLRGYAFQTLIQPLHLLGALIAANGIFAALHLWNPAANEFSVANTFLAGCVLGLLLVGRGNLWAPAGAHFGWNLAMPFLGVNISGMPLQLTNYSVEWHVDPLWTGGGYGPEGSVLCTGLLLLMVLVLVWIYYRNQDGMRAMEAK